MTGGGIYVHIPYCARKCIYCDFYSIGARGADWPLLAQRLVEEYGQRSREIPHEPSTLYFGGGTPSLMPLPQLEQLMAKFRDPSMTEITLEANPDDINPEKLEAWKQLGINRLSIGIQSFEDKALKAVGRRHDAETALNAIGQARTVFDNISLDLMFGLPGQSLESWSNSLDMALKFMPRHISAYSLMYEPGTALTVLKQQGRIKEADEELTEAMFNLLVERLKAHGYEHYEISNFALPGYRSRHNGNYWKGLPYLGLGPGAHSFDGDLTRRWNRPDLKNYLAGENIGESETLTPEERMEEVILTRLRTREGIDLAQWKKAFGKQALQQLLSSANRLIAERHLVEDSNHLHLSKSAILISDNIILTLASQL